MADVVGIKISQLESTTDLQDLYTIGTDKNNSSKKVKLQFLKEAADYANSQGDYAKGVADNSAGNIGVSDYPAFSESGSYASGDVVNYNGKLYRFTAPHQSGAWNGNDVVPTSINAESQRKLTELDQAVPKLVDNNDTADLEIADSQGNILVEFADGHIRTKNFNSRTIGATSSNSALAAKTWCSLGTSITWYNNNQGGRFEKGYQGWLMEKLPVGTLVNKGVSGGTLINLAAATSSLVALADIYTIEHGVNDWGKKTPIGTIDDYINNTGGATFYGAFRVIIDAIYAKNNKAIIILCTPRKARGFNGYLPDSCNGAMNGIYLKDYAEAVIAVARYEGLMVCDWFNECGVNDHNLSLYSIDNALHPNDLGYKAMAQLLIDKFKNIY